MPSAPHTYDVVGIGNAIVDILAQAPVDVVTDAGLAPGAMTLVDAEKAKDLYGRMGTAVEVSGGSVANSMAAIAALGGSAGYIGRVRDDQFGSVFAHDIRATGVAYTAAPASDGPPTAQCLVFVHPDAQRTMATYLGACVDLGPSDLDGEMIAGAQVTFLEGYLWDKPEAKAACIEASKVAHAHGRKLAMTLSDPFCVDRWRGEFLELIRDHVDVLFANEHELTSLFEVATFDEALQAARPMVETAALTRGPKGSVVCRGDEVHVVDAAAIDHLIDTTGAGDLYAAGFLRGYTGELELAACGRLGSLAAGTIVQQFGARPEVPLLPLVERAAHVAWPLDARRG